MSTLDQRNISNLHNQIRYFDNDPLIPSDLRITINTGVPGFQSIVYKPQMSIPDTKEKKIWFTPLVRLNQRIVDKVPPEYRIKQFFNKGLYESLLRYHGMVPIKKEDTELEDAEKADNKIQINNEASSNLQKVRAEKGDPNKNKTSSKDAAVWALKEAKTRGNFNNNIKVTLDTLFKNGSVLYIDKKPYVIVDTQMIQGDWSLDVKPAEMATIYNASQSNIYDKAEQVRRVELETAGLTSFTGENWVDRYPQFDKKNSVTTLKPGNGQNKNTGVLRIEGAQNTGAIVPRKQGSSFSDSFFDSFFDSFTLFFII
jgi:uncharacterized protein (DUF3084 family)